MRLISFAMVSLLAITVSAYPPHNPITQDLDRSQDASTQSAHQSYDAGIQDIDQSPNSDMPILQHFQESGTQDLDQSPDSDISILQYFQESDAQMLERILDSASQNMDRSQDASTQSVHQSFGDTTHNTQQFPGAATQSVHQSYDAGIQDIDQSPNSDMPILQHFQESDAQMLEKILDTVAQDMDQSPDASTQSVHQSFGDATHDTPRFPDAATQSTQQPQYTATRKLQQFMDAATQSAQQSPDAATQDIHEFQGISAQEVDEVLDATIQSAKQSDQNKVLVEMNRLTESLKIQDDRCSQIDLQINTEKQKNTEVRNMIDRIAIQLRRTGISSDKILELEKKSYDLKMVSDQLTAEYSEQHWRYEDAMTKRRDANAELKLLKENQELIAAYNSDYGIQVELSPNSCYSMGILLSQYDKALKRIDKLLVKQQTIDNAISVSNDDALKAKSAQLENEIQDLQSYSKIAKEILKQHKYNLPLDV
ncbi:hypothetical protein BASA61_006547 [Batrachochytrium salamandrivorans]|nr:hypothetical protein BASA61_006547 [Batrachochytrium salamandrivorans]